MEQTFSIAELAREFEVTPRTIRYYEAEGMLAPDRKGQRRIYSTRDRVTLALILRGKRLGFSLAEAKEIIELYDAPQGEKAESAMEQVGPECGPPVANTPRAVVLRGARLKSEVPETLRRLVAARGRFDLPIGGSLIEERLQRHLAFEKAGAIPEADPGIEKNERVEI